MTAAQKRWQVHVAGWARSGLSCKEYAAQVSVNPGMRRSFDGLALATRQVLGQDPRSGALFVFANRRGRQLRVLWWDGGGYSLLCRRLHQALFQLLKPDDLSDRSVIIDRNGLAALIRGVPTTRRRSASTSA